MLSIIIPLYNKQAVIARTIESILSQSYINWELIIVVDGSTDGSDEVVRLYLGDQRIRYIRKPNGGVSSARNRGIKEAKGEWICYIDADDYFLPEGLKTMVELAEKYNVTPNAIAIAWILRHPAHIQAIVGTTNRQRLKDICKASDVCLTREEWYELYLAAGKLLP